MDLEQDEVFGASSRDGDLTSASFRFRRSEEDSDTIPAVGSIHRGRLASPASSLQFFFSKCDLLCQVLYGQ
jgi:hypothetical protein